MSDDTITDFAGQAGDQVASDRRWAHLAALLVDRAELNRTALALARWKPEQIRRHVITDLPTLKRWDHERAGAGQVGLTDQGGWSTKPKAVRP
jgi:hypothetical protein